MSLEKIYKVTENKNKLSDSEIVIGVPLRNEQATLAFMEIVCKIVNILLKKSFEGLKVAGEDIAHDFYLHHSEKNWKLLVIYKFESKLETYLGLPIYRFVIKKYIKKSEYKLQASQVPLNELLLEITPNNVMGQIDFKLLKIELLKAINNLKNQEDRLVMLHILRNLKDPEIAALLNMNVNNIYVKRTRFINMMKNKLKNKAL